MTEMEMGDVSLPVDRVYRLLLEYFNRERIKVTHCSEPSYIEVKVGAWRSLLISGNSLGKIKINLVSKNEGSLVRFRGNFIKYYTILIIYSTIVVFLIEALFLMLGAEWMPGVIISLILTPIFMAYLSKTMVHNTKTGFIGKVTDFLEGHAKILPKPTERTPTAFMKKCVKCGIEIPIASEECPSCGSKQP